MYTRRRRGYFLLMGGCLILFVSAWSFVRIWSIPAAIGMCVVAAVIPPVAAIVGNSRGRDDRWWDETPGNGPPDRRPPTGGPTPTKPAGQDDSWTDLGAEKHRRRDGRGGGRSGDGRSDDGRSDDGRAGGRRAGGGPVSTRGPGPRPP